MIVRIAARFAGWEFYGGACEMGISHERRDDCFTRPPAVSRGHTGIRYRWLSRSPVVRRPFARVLISCFVSRAVAFLAVAGAHGS